MRGMGLIRAEHDARDFAYEPDRCVGASNLPDAYTDLIPHVHVLDQGITQSCVSCCASGALWLKQLVAHVPKPVFPAPFVSYLDARRMDMGRGGALFDRGTTFRNVFRALREQGVVDIDDWPMDYALLDSDPAWRLRRGAQERAWLKYYRIAETKTERSEALRRCLIQERTAIPAGFTIDATLEEWKPYHRPWKRTQSTKMLHGMLIVGYCLAGIYALNSWSKTFGNNGVCLIDWDAVEDEDEVFDLYVPQIGEMP